MNQDFSPRIRAGSRLPDETSSGVIIRTIHLNHEWHSG
jgi:hypothetical protein